MYSHSVRASAIRLDFTASRVLTTLSAMEGEESPVTKRQLGIALLFIGLAGVIALLAIDVIDVGRPGGIGPAQSLALAIMAPLALVGLSLIPRGDAPA